MAVTDLTDSLPWWLRQGTGPGGVMPGGGVMNYPATSGGGPNMGYPAQGPGPTGGPSAAPQGAGVAGATGNNQMGWLQYLQNMFGVSPAQADTLTQNQQINALLQAQANGATQPNANNAINPAASLPQGAMPARPATGMGLPPGALSSANLGAANNMPWPSGGGSVNPSAPPPPGQAAVGSAPPAANPLASSGGATGMGATSNPRFIGIAAPNFSPQNSMRGGPQGTALNLAGLFGGGGQAPAAANPATGPAASARPVSGRIKGPLAAPSGDDWDIDANGNVVPNYGPLGKTTTPDDLRRQRAMQLAAASLKQRYG